MKTADEMFRELGYVLNNDLSDIEDGTICYYNDIDKYYLFINPRLLGNGLIECKARKQTVGLSVPEIRAVCKLLDEMGWSERTFIQKLKRLLKQCKKLRTFLRLSQIRLM